MSQGFSKFYLVSINENQSEYNGQSESWIVSQWANDTAKVYLLIDASVIKAEAVGFNLCVWLV